MTPSIAQNIAKYEALLRERRRTLLQDIEGLDEERASTGGDLAGVPLHLADMGTDSSEHDVNATVAGSANEEIREIDEALARIQDGTYGLCEYCEKPIPEGRLEAIPYARLCIPCKTEEEAAEKTG
ncbi:MAG TPA: TraR/DksA C4-type zinc finger protein [Planctomycetota bacterium]|nr:TraR/DksA C4-type zinc finger protein [Planctomycetota bacterium]